MANNFSKMAITISASSLGSSNDRFSQNEAQKVSHDSNILQAVLGPRSFVQILIYFILIYIKKCILELLFYPFFDICVISLCNQCTLLNKFIISCFNLYCASN